MIKNEETIDHLLVTCVFARHFWFCLLRRFGLQELSPSADEGCFADWWSKVNNLVDGQVQKGLNYLIILGAWSLWKHRNRCVFDGMAPNLGVAWMLATEELHLWMLAGA